MFNKLRLENQLAELRIKWLKEPLNRPIIVRQARCLKLALQEYSGEVDAFKYLQETLKKSGEVEI